MALNALGNADERITLNYVKSRLLQEEQRSKMQGDNDKLARTSDSSALLDGIDQSRCSLFDRSRGAKTSQKHQCCNCGHDGHSANCCCLVT